MRSLAARSSAITREQADVLTALVLAEGPLTALQVADRAHLPVHLARAALLVLIHRGSACETSSGPAGAPRYEAVGVPT